MISGDANDHDSSMLANISYRNHFQDLYSNSSILKSIGREEEDLANINMMQQQNTDEHQLINTNGARTPDLGVDEAVSDQRKSGGAKNSSQ